MTSQQIYEEILNKPNCSCETAVGFIQNLHKYSAGSLLIIRSTDNPEESQQALMLKEQILGLLENYDRLKRGVPNGKRR